MEGISHKKYFMYGKHASMFALNNPNRKVGMIYCSLRMYNQYSAIIDKFHYKIKEPRFLTKLIKNDNHQGIVVYLNTIYQENASVDIFSNEKFIVILDQMQDSQNIGAIVRSANSFWIKNFIFTKNKSPSENGLIAKAAAGSLEYSKILVVKNLHNTINRLKTLGFWIVGLSNHAKTQLYKLTTLPKIAFIIGSEENGIRRLVLNNCDLQVRIPISEDVESLNASNAAAIAFYQFASR